MSEKRFQWVYIQDNKLELRDDGIVKVFNNERLEELLNTLHEENQELKKALLFFVDVANSECSSNWRKDMENACQKLFNCSYEEAKEKYGDYDGL